MFHQPLREALRQIGRWMKASEQDRHPYVALLHANYAVGNLDLIRNMFTDDEIFEQTGEHIFEIRKKAISLQDQARGRLMKYVKRWNGRNSI